MARAAPVGRSSHSHQEGDTHKLKHLNLSEHTMKIEIYKTANGTAPFQEWMASMKDRQMRLRINARLERLKGDNLGDWKSLSGFAPLIELRDKSGFRLYCVREEQTLIILLCGGIKVTQNKNIKQAWEYWHDYQQQHWK